MSQRIRRCRSIFRLVSPLILLFGLNACSHKIISVEPQTAIPGTMVLVGVKRVGSMRDGFYEVQFNGAPGTLVEPLIDEESGTGKVTGLYVLVPPQATTGPLTLVAPAKFGTLRRMGASIPKESDVILTIIPLSTPSGSTLGSAGGTGTPLVTSVEFYRLAPPYFESEVADSKDIGIADYNNDGLLDAFVPQTGNTTDTLYVGQGLALTGAPRFTVVPDVVTNDVAPKRQYGAAVGDVEGDGDYDVMPSGAGQQSTPHRIRLLLNDGTGTFTNLTDIRITGLDPITGDKFHWDDAKFGDLDGDGDLDIAMSNRAAGADADGRSAIIIQDGVNTGFFTAVPDAFGEPPDDVHHDVSLCDLNADGLPEVAFSPDMRGDERPLRVFYNLGGSPPGFVEITAQLAGNLDHHSEHIGCEDFDGNGLPDFHVGVWERSDRDPVSERYREDLIFLNTSTDADGDGIISVTETTMSAVSNPEIGGAMMLGFDVNTYSGGYGDFDGDGDVDILVGPVAPDPTQKGPFLMSNEGAGQFRNISPPNDFWRDLSNTGFDHFNVTSPDVADLNDDGKLDIIWGMGDGMNGPINEENRIYIQGKPPSACAVFQIPICRVATRDFFDRERIFVEFKLPGEVIVDPIVNNCRFKFGCPGCGGGGLGLCPNWFNFILDYRLTQTDPDVVDVYLVDGHGQRIADAHEIGDRVRVLSFKPRVFRDGALDQNIAVIIKLGPKGVVGERYEIPMSLDITAKALAPVTRKDMSNGEPPLEP